MQQDISKPSKEFEKNSWAWSFVADILGGTAAMRVLGRKYLPQHPAESDNNYAIRLSTATFAPLYQIMTSNMTGRVFSKEIQIKGIVEDSPILDWVEDIDAAGTHVSIFCQELFQRLIDYGLVYILVDYQKGVSSTTKEEEIASGARPYFVPVFAQDVIFLRMSKDGRKIEEARIKDSRVSYSESGEKTVEQITVYKPGEFEVFEKTETAQGKDSWVSIEKGTMTIPVVPLIPIMAHRCDSKPPLLEAAFLNVKYYQFESNHDNALTVAQFPILGATGIDTENDKLQIGPKKLITSTNPGAKFFYLEHSGVAIGCGKTRLEDIKAEMASMGMKFLQSKTIGEVGKTATENIIDERNDACTLQTIALRFADGIERAFALAVLWVASTEEPEVELRGNFAQIKNDPQELASLLNLKISGDLSQETLWEEYKRRGVLSDSFDSGKEKDRMAQEGPGKFEGE